MSVRICVPHVPTVLQASLSERRRNRIWEASGRSPVMRSVVSLLQIAATRRRCTVIHEVTDVDECT